MKPVFTIKFVPEPHVDGIRALRALLKAALRRFGLRAIDAREEIAASAATQSDRRRRSERTDTGAARRSPCDQTKTCGNTQEASI